jgi:TRAP-type C4-dicarboxylate transport system permease small subunit
MQKLFSATLNGIAGVALFAMMWLTFADVVGRKFFDHSLLGAVELTELLMTVMIFFALPLASLAAEHIVFDLLDRVLSVGMLRWQQVSANILAGAAFVVATAWVWERAGRTLGMGDETSALQVKLGPFHFLAAVAVALTAFIHFWQAWHVYKTGPVMPPGAPDTPEESTAAEANAQGARS